MMPVWIQTAKKHQEEKIRLERRIEQVWLVIRRVHLSQKNIQQQMSLESERANIAAKEPIDLSNETPEPLEPFIPVEEEYQRKTLQPM